MGNKQMRRVLRSNCFQYLFGRMHKRIKGNGKENTTEGKGIKMTFMERQIVFGHWWQVETADGSTEYVRADILDRSDVETGDFTNSDPITIEKVKGWGCRLSAPGYLDRTDWMVFDDRLTAIDALTDAFGELEENDG